MLVSNMNKLCLFDNRKEIIKSFDFIHDCWEKINDCDRYTFGDRPYRDHAVQGKYNHQIFEYFWHKIDKKTYSVDVVVYDKCLSNHAKRLGFFFRKKDGECISMTFDALFNHDKGKNEDVKAYFTFYNYSDIYFLECFTGINYMSNDSAIEWIKCIDFEGILKVFEEAIFARLMSVNGIIQKKWGIHNEQIQKLVQQAQKDVA